jgi:hypothetical protein
MNKPTQYFLRLFFTAATVSCILEVSDGVNSLKPRDRFPRSTGEDGTFFHIAAWMGGCFSRQAAQG